MNNIAKANAHQKCEELRVLLKPQYYAWFADYLVMKRIMSQPNLHVLYLAVLDVLSMPDLDKVINDSVL